MENNNDSLLAKLEELLKEELGIYAGLLELSRREQSILVKRKVEELGDVTKEIELRSLSLRKKEEERATVVRTLQSRLAPQQKKKLTLKALIAIVDEPYRTRYDELHQQLTGLMKELHYLNEYNASLVRHALEYTNYLLSLFAGVKKNPIYGATGDIAKSEERKFFDHHV